MKPDSRSACKPRRGHHVAALLLGLSLEAAALDPSALVPPGNFASLGTHRLYVDCRGDGEPRVLIDYGIGGAAVEWRAIQAALARDTTVCVYDRAGYGWSDPGPSPRTAAQAAGEIAALADAEGWGEPLVLVGHSFGGFDVRHFAATWPDRVAGLVLLDSSLAGTGVVDAPQANFAGRRHPMNDALLEEDVEDGDFAIARYLNSRRKAIFTQMDELGHFAESGAQVAAAGPLPPVPLVVVTRDPAHGAPDAAVEARWQEGQRALAAASPVGEWRTAEGSGHEIHRDRPDVVIDAVRRVLARMPRDVP